MRISDWSSDVCSSDLRVVDALDAVAAETGKSVPQIATAWLLARPTVSSVIIGARNETQLRDNLGAIGWELTDRKSVVEGKSVSVRVDLGGRRLMKKKTTNYLAVNKSSQTRNRS